MRNRKKLTRIVYVLILIAFSLVGIQCNSVKDKKTSMTPELKKFFKLFKSARKLTPQEALELDKLVDKEPDNLDAVTKWLIYNSSRQFKDKKIKKKREKIIFYLIENHPEDAILAHHYTTLYKHINNIATGTKLWKAQVKKHPKNLKVLSNAAQNLLFADEKLCEKYLKKGQELDPNNPKWSVRLGRLYTYMSNKAYTKAYAEFKRAYKQTTIDKQSSILSTLGQIAYILKKYKDAEKYANIMLERSEKISKISKKRAYLYNANTLLGLLALKDGKTEEACKYLTKSGEIIVSTKLPYFYIDMSLACMLTFKGKDKCVLEYLVTVEKALSKNKFPSRNNYKEHIKDLKAGIMPEYKRLSYFNYVPLMNKINTARRNKFLSIGKTLSAKEAAVIEKEFAKLPNKKIYKAYGTITKLVAYYYVNKDKDKSIPEKRRQFVYRLVKYFPRYSLLAYSETWLPAPPIDKKLIEMHKANIKKFRVGDACPLNKAAFNVARHDKKLAEKAFLKGHKVKPSDTKWKKKLKRFHAKVKLAKPYMSSNKIL